MKVSEWAAPSAEPRGLGGRQFGNAEYNTLNLVPRVGAAAPASSQFPSRAAAWSKQSLNSPKLFAGWIWPVGCQSLI